MLLALDLIVILLKFRYYYQEQSIHFEMFCIDHNRKIFTSIGFGFPRRGVSIHICDWVYLFRRSEGLYFDDSSITNWNRFRLNGSRFSRSVSQRKVMSGIKKICWFRKSVRLLKEISQSTNQEQINMRTASM